MPTWSDMGINGATWPVVVLGPRSARVGLGPPGEFQEGPFDLLVGVLASRQGPFGLVLELREVEPMNAHDRGRLTYLAGHAAGRCRALAAVTSGGTAHVTALLWARAMALECAFVDGVGMGMAYCYARTYEPPWTRIGESRNPAMGSESEPPLGA